MRQGPWSFLPKSSLADVFMSSLREQLCRADADFGPRDHFIVAVNSVTAGVLMKARNLHSLAELRDWLGVKAVLTFSELNDGTAVVWKDDSAPKFWRMLE